jgi:hypothetical protein
MTDLQIALFLALVAVAFAAYVALCERVAR